MGDERENLPTEEREGFPQDDDVEAHSLPSEEREAAPSDEREAFPEGDKRDAFPDV